MTPGPFVSCLSHKLDMKDANGVIIESANPLALSKHNTNLKVKFIVSKFTKHMSSKVPNLLSIAYGL